MPRNCAAQCWNTLSIPWKQDQEPYELQYVFRHAMDGTLPCYILWLVRTENHSFWCLDAWKGVGFNWTNVVSLARSELSTSSMSSTLAHNVSGEQRQVKPWDIPSCHMRRILASSCWRKTNSGSPKGVYQRNGGQPYQEARADVVTDAMT